MKIFFCDMANNVRQKNQLVRLGYPMEERSAPNFREQLWRFTSRLADEKGDAAQVSDRRPVPEGGGA